MERSLEYPEDSAGRIMQTDLIAVPPFWSVGQTIDHMRETETCPTASTRSLSSIRPIICSARWRSTGCSAPSGRSNIEEITDPDIHPVDVTADQEEVARHFERYNLTSAPVVDPGQAAGRRYHR